MNLPYELNCTGGIAENPKYLANSYLLGTSELADRVRSSMGVQQPRRRTSESGNNRD